MPNRNITKLKKRSKTKQLYNINKPQYGGVAQTDTLPQYPQTSITTTISYY